MPTANYGIDSPSIIIGEFIASGVAFLVALFFPHFLWLPMRTLGVIGGAYFLYGALGMVFYSKVGKLRLRDRLLSFVPWRGDESVLDVGCGRGLLLIGAAKRLTTGKAIGVDVWVPGAITGNRAESVLENAALEGVADRVEVKQGDARQLPFPDASFDVVLSNFVLHELETAREREAMTGEILRVLKPGGHLALVDFIFTGQCVQVLLKRGVANSRRMHDSFFSFWFTSILSLGMTQVYFVTGAKSSDAGQPSSDGPQSISSPS